MIDSEQLQKDVNGLINDSSTVNTKLDYFDNHLAIKKRVNDMKKEFQSTIWNVAKKLIEAVNQQIEKKPVKTLYKAAAGDEVDRMLAELLNRLGIPVPIKRLGGGYYMFGTKKIYCKIINGKLVVRVGGGYMGIEEFI